MDAKAAFRNVVEFSHVVVRMYVEDLDDADLLVRSVPGTNHVAWQLGHLIASNRGMLAALGHPAPALPAGFETAHNPETAASDDPRCFASKADYLAMAEQMKDATLAAIDATPEDAMDQPGPESMREYAPTVGAVLMLMGTHWMMHAGQFIPVRRRLGKPALF